MSYVLNTLSFVVCTSLLFINDMVKGAFLVSYFFFLFACGVPLFFMELGLGQYTGLSPIRAFNLAPISKGE
ncbi:unnamed protein product [Protopolystoma xenopodis]|uniref:Uncharacterized protein n=1 Tax=Protopolystoma xenopodis TaxID=117903 RepID=A0A448WNC5_9PLAT|nr:unnamed protein product [Protopolystoma xenopodis]